MQQVVTRQHRPAYRIDLSALMAVCETNYWRLQKLLLPVFPELQKNTVFNFSIPSLSKLTNGVERERVLCMKITEQCPYTTTLNFSEITDAEDVPEEQLRHWGLSPQLTVRIYHDAKTAEVVAFQGQRHFMGVYEYPNSQMHQRDEKLQLNTLLADWLNHCLQNGYRTSQH